MLFVFWGLASFIKPNDFHLQSFCYKRQDFILLYAQIVLKRLYTLSLSTDEHLSWFSILPIVTWASVSMAVSDVGVTSNNYTLIFISNGDIHKPHQNNKKTMHCSFAKTYVLLKKNRKKNGWGWYTSMTMDHHLAAKQTEKSCEVQPSGYNYMTHKI